MYFYSQGSNLVECVCSCEVLSCCLFGGSDFKRCFNSCAVGEELCEVFTWKVNVGDVPNQGLALNTELGCGLTATPEGSVWHHTELGCWPTVSPDGVWHHTWVLTDSIVIRNIKYCLQHQKAVVWHHTEVSTYSLTDIMPGMPDSECWLWRSDWHQSADFEAVTDTRFSADFEAMSDIRFSADFEALVYCHINLDAVGTNLVGLLINLCRLIRQRFLWQDAVCVHACAYVCVCWKESSTV